MQSVRKVPMWVREFFHPETLRETLAWTLTLRERRRWFLLASLLGILHHQRPGFLSFPSSHTVPYLRKKAFPPAKFPELYESTARCATGWTPKSNAPSVEYQT